MDEGEGLRDARIHHRRLDEAVETQGRPQVDDRCRLHGRGFGAVQGPESPYEPLVPRRIEVGHPDSSHTEASPGRIYPEGRDTPAPLDTVRDVPGNQALTGNTGPVCIDDDQVAIERDGSFQRAMGVLGLLCQGPERQDISGEEEDLSVPPASRGRLR